MRVCFIGHRDIYDKRIRLNLKNILHNLIDLGAKSFVMGKYGCFDNLALECCKSLLKDNDIHIEIVCAYLQRKQELCDDYIYRNINFVMYDIEMKHYKERILYSNKKW